MKFVFILILIFLFNGCGSGSDSKLREKRVHSEDVSFTDLLELSNVGISDNYKPRKLTLVRNFPTVFVAGFPGYANSWTVRFSVNGNCLRSEGSFGYTPRKSSSNGSKSIEVTGIFFKERSQCGEWEQSSIDLHTIGRIKFDHDLFMYNCRDYNSVADEFIRIMEENFQKISRDDNWIKPDIGLILISNLPLK